MKLTEAFKDAAMLHIPMGKPHTGEWRTGYIGEAVFQHYFPKAERVNKADYDFMSKGKRIEVKTRMIGERIHKDMRLHLKENSLAQRCDYFVFILLDRHEARSKLAGYIGKSLFMYYCNYHHKIDTYSIPLGFLDEFK